MFIPFFGAVSRWPEREIFAFIYMLAIFRKTGKKSGK